MYVSTCYEVIDKVTSTVRGGERDRFKMHAPWPHACLFSDIITCMVLISIQVLI